MELRAQWVQLELRARWAQQEREQQEFQVRTQRVQQALSQLELPQVPAQQVLHPEQQAGKAPVQRKTLQEPPWGVRLR
ncbi:MAG: hypothetical protein ACK57O_22870 [Planctomyces sp.]